MVLGLKYVIGFFNLIIKCAEGFLHSRLDISDIEVCPAREEERLAARLCEPVFDRRELSKRYSRSVNEGDNNKNSSLLVVLAQLS